MASEMLLKNLVTMKAKNQLKVAAAELAVDLISGTQQEGVTCQVVIMKTRFLPDGINSDEAIHGIGPKPNEKAAINIIKLKIGRKAILPSVSLAISSRLLKVK